MRHVTLTPDEFTAAALHATHVTGRNLAEGNQGLNGQPMDNWVDLLRVNVGGACAELAFCKSWGVWWTGLADRRAPDTPMGEVRWVTQDHYGLLLRQRDKQHKPDALYWLVKGNGPRLTIVGSMEGRDAMTPAYWDTDDRGGCWKVPQRVVARGD